MITYTLCPRCGSQGQPVDHTQGSWECLQCGNRWKISIAKIRLGESGNFTVDREMITGRNTMKRRWGKICCIFSTHGLDGFKEEVLPYVIYTECKRKLLKHEKNDTEKRQVFRLIGGPVGIESFYISKATLEMLYKNGWTVCDGNGMYDRCFIEGDEIMKHTKWYMEEIQ